MSVLEEAKISALNQDLLVTGAHGTCGALLVGPTSGDSGDDRCMPDAIDRSDGRFQCIAVVPLDLGDEALVDLRALGAIGIAFHTARLGTAFYAHTASLLQRLAALNMLASLQRERDQLIKPRPMFKGSAARTLIDHFGRPAPECGIQQPSFQAPPTLARSGRVAVKLSGQACWDLPRHWLGF